MARQLGTRNVPRDARQMHVLQRQNSMRTTSALDYWDQLVTLHYGTRDGICSHFREATIAETGMAWAGAPFAVPGVVALANSILYVSTINRAFVYQNMAATNEEDKLGSVALQSNTLNDQVGLRVDDGTDNNYMEINLRLSQASPTLWGVRTRRRTGGGAVTTQDSDDMHTDPGFVLHMVFTGTLWEAWGVVPWLHTNMGFGGTMRKPAVMLGGANLAFTPTRAGIVFNPGAEGETYMEAHADWFDIGRA